MSVARGRKQVGNDPRRRQRIAFRHVERQAVAENSARVNQRNGAVMERLGIQFHPRQPVRGEPERRGGKLDGVFEIAALHLKVVRTQVHAFRPHHPR